MRIIFKPSITSIFTFFTLSATLLWHTVAMADVAIIAHPAASIGRIDPGTVKSIYLGKLKFWPDGSVLTVVDQARGSEARKLLLNKVVGKKESKFDSYWSKKTFSGKGMPLKQLGDDTDVKAWISQDKGSIGYIDANSVDKSVKILMIIK